MSGFAQDVGHFLTERGHVAHCTTPAIPAWTPSPIMPGVPRQSVGHIGPGLPCPPGGSCRVENPQVQNHAVPGIYVVGIKMKTLSLSHDFVGQELGGCLAGWFFCSASHPRRSPGDIQLVGGPLCRSKAPALTCPVPSWGWLGSRHSWNLHLRVVSPVWHFQ